MDIKMKEASHQQSLPAKCVYVLTKKGCSSKNAQISWYFRNFNEIIAARDKKKGADEDDCFEILSVIQPDNVTEWRGSLVLAPDTQVTFISQKYSLVFVLHCNPFLASPGVVSNQVGIIFKTLSTSLKNIMKSLAKPFCIPGTTEQMHPEIHFSILLFTSVSSCLMKQVIIHGSILSLDTIEDVIKRVEKELQDFESNMATAFEANVTSLERGIGYFRDAESPRDSLSSPVGDRNAGLVLSEKVFILMMRQCLLTLKLLGQSSATGIVILTDGCLGMPDSSAFDITVQQLRCDHVAISFVQLKEAPTFFDGYEKHFFGDVPNVEFMHFIATVTGGTYFSRVPRLVATGEPALTAVHRGFLCRDLYRCPKLCPGLFSAIEPDAAELSQMSLEKSLCMDSWQVPLATQFFVNFTVTSSVMALVSCRVKEGYLLRSITITKGEEDETKMMVLLSYPWRYSIYIHYRIISTWAGPHSRKQMHLDVWMEAPSRFITDMSYLPRLNQNFKSTYPRATLKRCLTFLKNIQQTDKLLAHLRLFASNHNYFTISDGLKAGKPLLVPHASNQKEFVANPEVVNANTSEFHHFWKQMATVDVTNWQKWFDVHAVEVLLEHDEPMSRHVVSSAPKLAHCRRSQEAFYQCLQRFTSFVLVDKTSYVGIVYSPNDKIVPVSYYVLKVESRTCHVIIHVGFIGDKCFSRQMEKMNQLRQELREARIDQQSAVLPMPKLHHARKPPKSVPRSYAFSHPTASSQAYHSSRGLKTSSSPEEGASLLPLVAPQNATVNCCHVLEKSVDKIQIIYDKVPQDFLRTDLVPATDDKGNLLSATVMATNVMTSISNLLYHRRWVWSLKESDSSPTLVSTTVMDRILYNIIRLRLDEGFHFIGCSQGIIRMAAEFEMFMKEPIGKLHETTCIVQFIIFSPSFLSGRTRNDSHQSDAPVTETGQSHSSLSREEGIHLIMECWVEPQFGVVCGENPKIKDFFGLEYHQIPNAIYLRDRKCISAFVTLEKLVHVCQHPEAALPFKTESSNQVVSVRTHHSSRFYLDSSNATSQSTSATNHLEHHIDHVPFPFDPIALTMKCQQVELTFSLFSEDHSDALWNPGSVFPFPDHKVDGAMCPNNLVILLFNEQLKGLHNREFNLPTHACQELIKSLKARERDFSARPLPFGYGFEGSIPGIKVARSSQEGENFSPLRSPVKGGTRRNVEATDSGSEAQWKCYLRLMKSSGSSIQSGGSSSMNMHPQQNLVITLVPATYEDILKLNRVEPSAGNVKDRRGSGSGDSRKGGKEGDKHERERPDMKGCGRVHSLPNEMAFGEDEEEGGDEGEESVKDACPPFETSRHHSSDFASPPAHKHQFRRSTGQESVTFAAPGSEVGNEIAFIPEHPPNYWCGPVLPVYVYNCSTTTFSDLLLNLRTTQKIPDLYEDLTFEDDFVSSSHQKSSILSQSPEKMTCLISSNRKVSECESTSSREKWRRAGDDLYKNQEDLKQHSTLVSETYLRCFVSAMYESLRSGYNINKKDVNAAIYNICEESQPIEIDITEFLKHSCNVFQAVQNPVATAGSTGAAIPTASSSLSEIKEGESGNEESGSDGSFPVITLNKLLENHSCESRDALHASVKARFLDIISAYFSPVTSHPECLFCCETTKHREALESLNLKDNDEDSLSEAAEKLIGVEADQSGAEDIFKPFAETKTSPKVPRGSNTTPSNSATVAVSTASDDQFIKKAPLTTLMTTMNTTTMSSSNATSHQRLTGREQESGRSKVVLSNVSSNESADSEESARMERALQGAKQCHPLFLHLTLSIRSGDKFFSSQVDSLPVCAADLKACLQETGDVPFDGSSFKATLDIFCLSLSVVEDLGAMKDRPCYSRLTSINSSSQRSTQTGSSDCEDENVEEEEEAEERTDGTGGVGRCHTSDVLEVGSLGSADGNKGGENPSHVLGVSDSDKGTRYHGNDYDEFDREEGRGTRHHNLAHLPKSQQLLVLVCRNLIIWLLNDEIVSSLRSIFPVTEATLDRVTNHIRTSQSKHKMCQYTEVTLQFVFGPEKSLSLFVEQFEKMKLDQVDKMKPEKFQLIRSGGYYYLCKPYVSEMPLDNLQDFTNALQDIHNAKQQQQSLAQNRSSSLESTGAQKSETAEGQSVADDCLQGGDPSPPYVIPIGAVEQKSADASDVASSADVTSRKPSDEGAALNASETDPNVRPMTSGSSPKKDHHHLMKMASIGGIGDDEEDDAAKHQLAKESVVSKKMKHFFLSNQTASTPGIGGGPESRRMSCSTVSSNQPNKSCVSSSQTINTYADDSPATPPALTSQAFVAVSSSGDRYIKKVEGFSLDAGDMKRVRPISGPPGLDGGTTGLGPMSLLPVKLKEKEEEFGEDVTYTSATCISLASCALNSKVQLIKRAQSSTSFDKTYASPGGAAGKTTSHQTGGQQPHRSRHTSGRDTPISAVDTSSITTGGYDADWSEIDDEGNPMTLENLNSSTVRRRLLVPNFWQILKVLEDRVLVFFHCRETKPASNGTRCDSVNREVVNNVNKICHLINQKLLLKDLWDKKSCNPLLVAEADEDVRWSKDSRYADDHHGNGKKKVPYMRQDFLSDSDDEFTAHGHYLAASTQFSSGHFKCSEQFTKVFTIHPRQKGTSAKASTSSAAMTTLRAKLSLFAVSNRSNTYVLMDSTQAIFYACLSETTYDCLKTSHQPLMRVVGDGDDIKLQVSHNSADLLSSKRMNRLDEEPKNSPTSYRIQTSDPEMPPMTPNFPLSQPNLSVVPFPKPVHPKPKDKVTMTVYGTCRPDKQITVELVSVMQKELDDKVLESICFMFSRNPNSKLTVDDVHFIQRPGTQPIKVLKFLFPTAVILHQHAFGFYLRQNLQSYLIPPKYHDPSNPDNLFQPFRINNEKQVPPAPPLSSEFIRSLPGSFFSHLPVSHAPNASAAVSCVGAVVHSSSSSSLSSSNQPMPSAICPQNPPSAIGGGAANADQDVLLYIRPQHDGSRGIACIHLSFVDGKGHPVQLLGSPKPSPGAYKELSDKSLYEALLQVNKYEHDSKQQSSKSPGPLSLIQFGIWVCGNIDLASLSAMLEQSVRHAIQDLVFEYRLLTAPISEVPFHYTKGVDSPLHSAPVSPRFNANNSNIWPPALRSALPPEISRTSTDLGRTLTKTPNELVLFPSRHFLKERSTTVTFDCDATYMEDEQYAGYRLLQERSLEVDEELMKKIRMYEEGMKGPLNPIFASYLPYWFEICCKTNTPSVSKHQYSLVSLPAVELLLRKIPEIFTDQLGDVNVVFFREKPGSASGSDPAYEPFEFCKDLMHSQSSFDENQGNACCSKIASHRDSRFVIVCRNISYWRQSLDNCPSFIAQSACSRTTSLQSPAPQRTSKITYKKFPALDEDSRLRSDSSFSPLYFPEKLFVPRQFLLLVTCHKKSVTLYQYNLSSDVVSNVDKQLMKHVYWHNARSHVLCCIASQKLGLFHHTHYSEPPPEKHPRFTSNQQVQDPNPFLTTAAEFDQLVCHAVVPSGVGSQKMRNRSGSMAVAKATGIGMAPLVNALPVQTVLDHLYLDSKPSVPMRPGRTPLGGRDKLRRHGCQANHMKNEIKQETVRKERMQKLYNLCEGRNTHQTLTLSPSDLDLLKKSSRILHQVMSPLLFSPIWQRESPLTTDSSFFIPSITTATKAGTNQSEGCNQFEKKRSRHSSGSSVRSKRSDSMEQTARRLMGAVLTPIALAAGSNQPTIVTTTSSGASLDQMVQKSTHHGPLLHQLSLPVVHTKMQQVTKEFESEWHKKICHYMSRQYISYLSPFYFYPLKVAEPNQQSGTTGDKKGSPSSTSNSTTCYMHKSLQGGLILVEVGFLPTHFYVTIFAFQASASSINTQLSVIFTDECDKIKDAIHLNSFCHDFHLRVVQTFVQNESSPESTVLPLFYPVTRYLREVVSYFPYEPNYSWNYVHEDNMTVPCGHNSPLQLFEYMNKHAPNMKSISMNPFMSEEDLPALREHALMCPLVLTNEECLYHGANFADLQTFDVGLLLALGDRVAAPSSGEPASLPLKFWIVLTNRYQIYPKDSLEKKRMSSSSSSSPSSPAMQSPFFHSSKQCANPTRAEIGKSLAKLRREQMDYLGYSNIHQIPLYIILQPVTIIARERIRKVANEMVNYCYRDHLWMRLLVSDEESRRKRKTGEVEESKDPAMAKLNCSELKTLLSLVRTEDLCKVDPRLLPIVELPSPTIQQLLNALLDRFKNDSRYFTESLDVNSMKRYLIILNPKALDVCIMFEVDDPRRDADGKVISHVLPRLTLVVREEAELKEDTKAVVRQHVEHFVSVATYQLWLVDWMKPGAWGGP